MSIVRYEKLLRFALIRRCLIFFINFKIIRAFCNFYIGARDPEVEEPVLATKSVLFEFEVDEIPQPKALVPQELLKLILKFGSSRKVAIAFGASEAFVRQNIKTCIL
jgi:hypothetical protein